MITVSCFSVLLAAAQNADIVNKTQLPQDIKNPGSVNIEMLEEVGSYEQNVPSTTGPQRKIQLNRLGQVLLIPESTNDVVGMYDPFDGTYLGNLIVNSPALLSTPINAIPGPDGNIYLSDQVSDAVFVYDTLGVYLYTYADASDGLNNIRGIDFRDGHLFVTSGDDYVREFSGPHTFVRDFIADGSDPFDILFLDDGRSLLCDIQLTTDNVRLYDTSGTLINQIFSVDFPEQVQFDEMLPGEFLNASFSDNVITDFELNGTIINTLPYSGGPRGIYRLGNGNLLATNGMGIHELDPVTGAIIQTENTGSGRFIELYTVATTQSIFWDFETGLQGWTHTNGYPFPRGWDVEPSVYDPAWTPPDAGDSTMWIDSDAAGSVLTEDTAWSPAVVPPTNMAWLKYGLGYDNLTPTSDSLYVGVMTFTSGAWNPPTQLKRYSADYGPAWDSLDVSAYSTADSIRIYFYYSGSYDWYAAFDNVGLYPPPAHDVGCTEITSPPDGFVMPPYDYDVIGRIRNFGGAAETFDVVANVYDTLDSWNLIFTQTVTFTDFPIAGDSLHNFGLVTFEEDKVYYTEIYTTLSGDAHPENDTSAIYSNTFYDIIWDFETGWQGWTHTNGQAFPFGWDVLASTYVYPAWTPPDAGDSCMWIDSDSAGVGPVVEDTAWSPSVVTPVNMQTLRYGLGYNNLSSTSDSLYVGVMTFTSGAWNPPTQLKRYSADYGPAWDSLDVSAYSTADSIRIYFYYSGSYDWYAAFDNVMIKGIGVGIAEEPGTHDITSFGFAATMPTMAKGQLPISYATTMPGHVSLKIYDRIGRLVQTLVDEHQTAGEKSLVWNGADINNRVVANGVYFFKLEAENQHATHKLILIK